jgi:Ca2+-binding EF-hand superfamily protein
MDPFKNFIRNNLNLDLKKREENVVSVILDTIKNNKIAREEFMLLMNKEEKLPDEPSQSKAKNNLVEDLEESKRKEPPIQSNSSTQYSSNPKTEIIKTIHASGMQSIEEFLNIKLQWSLSIFVDSLLFYTKVKRVFKNVPNEDLIKLFNQLDVMGEMKIKVGDMVKELKNSIRTADDETKALLTIEDIKPNIAKFTPRGAGSFIIGEIKNHSDRFNYKLEEIFMLSKTPDLPYATKDSLRTCLRQFLPKCSREIIDESINFFRIDKVDYEEFLIIFDLKEVKTK